MEMMGEFYRPIQEAEKDPLVSVETIDRVLKSVIPDASFDGSVLTRKKKKGSFFIPFEYVPDKDTAIAVNELSKKEEAEDLVRVLLLQSMKKKMMDLRDPHFQPLIHQIGLAVNAIPGKRRSEVDIMKQKINARIADERRRALAEQRRLEFEAVQRAESLRRRALAEQRRLEFEAAQHAESLRLKEQKAAEKERRRLDFARLTPEEEEFKRAYETQLSSMGQDPEPKSFARVGTEERRHADQLRQEEFAKRFAEEKSEKPELAFGDLLEAFMQVELTRQDWFGARFARTSKYDDFFNGTDGMLEWPGDTPESSARLAIDFTVAENDEVLKKKCGKVERGVHIQYFRSATRDARGRTYEAVLDNVPMVILGVDRAMLRKILEETKGDPDKLREHPLRALLIEQATAQVGLQVREMCARLVGNVIGREDRVSPALRDAVRSYVDGVTADRTYTKDVPVVAQTFSDLSEKDIAQGFQDKGQASRLSQLLRVFVLLEERRNDLREEREPARQWMGQSKTHERLARGLAALRLGRFGMFGEFPRLGFLELFQQFFLRCRCRVLQMGNGAQCFL